MTATDGTTARVFGDQVLTKLDELLKDASCYSDETRLHLADTGGVTLGFLRSVSVALSGLLATAEEAPELYWHDEVWTPTPQEVRR